MQYHLSLSGDGGRSLCSTTARLRGGLSLSTANFREHLAKYPGQVCKRCAGKLATMDAKAALIGGGL
jgi:hypothetical protein